MHLPIYKDYLVQRIKPGNTYEELLLFPSFFEIETVHACNAKCAMCPGISDSRPKKPMEKSLFSKIVQEIAPNRDMVRKVSLFRDGEPLLDPHIVERIVEMKDAGIHCVSTTSNMSLMNEGKAEGILRSGLDVIDMSIDGFTEDTYSKIRCGLKYKTVRDNVLRFIAMRDKINPNCQIRIRFVLQQDNEHEWDEFHKFWTDKLSEKDVVLNHPIHNWGGNLDSFSPVHKSLQSRVPCVAPWSLMVIFVNGLVPLCNVDFEADFILGDITKQTILDVWNSKTINDVREKHLNNKASLPLCKDCNAWDEPSYQEESITGQFLAKLGALENSSK